ncbi:MAG: peptidase S41 [Saprospiraceae bacterium]|nr:peptidase S41 [Saprospiraceae bacterium]
MIPIKKISISALLLFFFLGCGTPKTQNIEEASKSYKDIQGIKLSIVQKLNDEEDRPVTEKIALFHQLKKESPNLYDFKNEDELTMFGYSALWAGNVKDAISIFKLIVSEFPGSANAYDSLGEAYLADGQKDLSISNYQKSLELNPDNFNAEDYIERILHPEIKIATPNEKFVKVYDQSVYIADLEQMGKKLAEVHPNVFKFISKEQFWQLIKEKQSEITPRTTFGQFAWMCSEIISSVKCSHTSMESFFRESEMMPVSMHFPIQTRWVNDQLFVINPLNNKDIINIKDEITHINGVPVKEMMSEVYKHIISQGQVQTTKKHAFNTWFSCIIPYALNFPQEFEVSIKGKTKPIKLKEAAERRHIYDDPSIKPCPDYLCLEIIEQDKIAYMTIGSFNYYPWNNLETFKKFIDSSFTEINENKIQNLVIDVRMNGGGSRESSIYLLKHLVSKPFTYYSRVEYPGKSGMVDGETPEAPFDHRFKGKLFFIIDGLGNSTTGQFMSIVKALNLGTIIGEELGSNQFCSAGQTTCRLSNTKLVFHVANNTHVTSATELPDEKGILPDHYVTQNIDDYLNRVDVVRNFTLHLVKQSK